MTVPMRALGLVLAGATEVIDTPAPGTYPDTSMRDYHRWDAMSNSRLTALRRSPAHLQAYIAQQSTDTVALAIGRAVHSAILEPDDFTSVYVVAEQCGATKKGDGLRCGNAGVMLSHGGWLCGVHAKGISSVTSVTVLPPNDYAVCLGARDAVHAHGRARGLLTGNGGNELSILWTDIVSGVACKARLDRYSPAIAGGAIVDIKTTRDASPLAFERSIFNFGYHRQGAHYLAGANASGLPAQHFAIIAVEKEPPYAVAVYRLTEGALDAGAQQITPLLARYAACQTANHWPAYSEDVQDIALPNYAWGQIDDETKETT